MADQVTLQGLQQMAKNNSGIGTVNPIDAMGWSDLASIAASTTSIAAATNKQVNALDLTPTLSSEEVTYTATLTSGQLNTVTIICITLHYDGASTNTGVAAGVDGLSFLKKSTFAVTSTMKINHTNV